MKLNPIIFDGTKESKCLPEMASINDDNYYDDRTYITNSMLGRLAESPATLQSYLDGGAKLEGTALSMGDALHKAMLEPEKYETMVAVWTQGALPKPDKTMRTKENKEWLEEFKRLNPGKCILKDTEFLIVQGMIESLRNKPDAMKWFEDAEYEHISLCEINDVPCKSKGDIVRNDDWLIDLKTTQNCSIDAFKESCEKYGYYRQAAMYCRMFNKKKFGFLVIEKKAPFRVAFYKVSPEKLKLGWEQCMHLLDQYKYYFVNDPLGFAIDEAVMTGVL